jgi:hypothetical protein
MQSSSITVSLGSAYTRLNGVHISAATFVVIAKAPSIIVISSPCIGGMLRMGVLHGPLRALWAKSLPIARISLCVCLLRFCALLDETLDDPVSNSGTSPFFVPTFVSNDWFIIFSFRFAAS